MSATNKRAIASPRHTLSACAAIALLWLFLIGQLAAVGFFARPSPIFPSWIQVAILAPPVTFTAAWLVWPGLRDAFAGVGLFFLTALQTYRILGLSILILWGYGLLPGGFAIPMSILDASAGVLALNAIWRMNDGRPNWLRATVIAHVWGFLDFGITIFLALFFWTPTFLDPAVASGGYASLAFPPLSLFPTFAIPFFSIAHIAALFLAARTKSPHIAG